MCTAYAPFWGLLGEFDLESVSNYVPPYTAGITSALVPLFLWSYCFIATVILVNLLIAQMSSSYTKVEEAAFQHHNWAYMEIVRDAKDTFSVWQPPLNFVHVCGYLWKKFILGKCKNPQQASNKGFTWKPDTPREANAVYTAQQRFAKRSIKRREADRENRRMLKQY